MTYQYKKTGFASVAALAVGALVAFGGEKAEAAVIHMNTSVGDASSGGVNGPFNVSSFDIFRFLNSSLDNSDVGGAFYGFEFTANPLPQPVNANLTLNRQGEFENFAAYWSDDAAINAGDTELTVNASGSLGVIDQNFSFSQSPQFLLISYDSADNDASLDIRVQAVPLPASALLLLGGLGGLGGLSALRRRKRAA